MKGDKVIQVKGNRPQKVQQNQGFIKCQKCGGMKFEQVFVLRQVTPLQDPNLLKNTIMPIPMFNCIKCGHTINIYG